MALEIKIPKEIKEYKEKAFGGLTWRQVICSGIALLVCAPIYIYGKSYIGEEMVGNLILLIAAPLVLIGFFKYNGMNFEELFLEIISFYFIKPQKRKYMTLNYYEKIIAEYEAEEKKKKRKTRMFKERKKVNVCKKVKPER